MSGTPQKMLEHLLETRLGQMGPNDPFLDDFLLTHIVFMPVGHLVEELLNHFHSDFNNKHNRDDNDLDGDDDEADNISNPEDHEYSLMCKKRVILFLQKWVFAVRHAVFEDSTVVDFIEVGGLFFNLLFFALFNFSHFYCTQNKNEFIQVGLIIYSYFSFQFKVYVYCMMLTNHIVVFTTHILHSYIFQHFQITEITE